MADLELVRQHHYELAADRGTPDPLAGFPRRCTDCGCFLKHEPQLDVHGYGRSAEYVFWVECIRCGKLYEKEI